MTEQRIHSLVNLIQTDQNTNEVCSSFVQDLKKSSLSIVQLVESLESLLTSTDIALRCGGSEFLSSILSQLPPNHLNAQEIELLASFFCDRLLDHHSLTPAALKAFAALLQMEHLPDGIVSKIFTVMNLHFVCQSQQQCDRLLCYNIFTTMMLVKPTELQALGPDFVCGCLTAIDSERDPRNLMYLFTNLPHFFRTFPPGHLIEDAFETVSCYFPIDFRTNPNDPRGISRQDLSNALLPCLTAIPEFVSFVVPLALEKLTSDLQVAKTDSVVLLKECFNKFSNEKMISQIDSILPVVLQELRLEVTKDDYLELIADLITCIVRYLVKLEKSQQVSKVLHDTYRCVQHYLNEAQLNHFQQTIKFLTLISLASASSSSFIAIKVVPKIMSLRTSSVQHLITQLISLKSILSPCITFNIQCNDIPELHEVWNQVPQLFLTHCESDSSEVKATSIQATTSILRLFRDNERELFYDTLSKTILLEEDENLSFKCTTCLQLIAQVNPKEVHSVMMTKLESLNEQNQRQKRMFGCYCILGTVPGFLTYLDKAIKKHITNHSGENAAYLIESLKYTICMEKENTTFLNALHREINVTEYLLNWWHEGCNALEDDSAGLFDNEQIASNLQFIISVILRQLNQESQKQIVQHYFQLTLDYSKKFMNSFAYLDMNEDLNTPKVHCSLSIITFESIVNGIEPNVLENGFKDELGQIIKYLITLSIYCSRPLCCLVACRSIASVFNKMTQSTNLENQVTFVFNQLHEIFAQKSTALKSNAVDLLIYVTKALLLRGFSGLQMWFDQLIELIKDEEIGKNIAQGFRLILTEDEYFLSNSCHCTIKLFYRQRIFSYVTPKLADLHRKSDSLTTKKRYAIASLYLLEGVPQTVIEKYFKLIIPLLVEFLELNGNSELTQEALFKLSEVMSKNPSLFEEYIETFIPKLLNLSRNAAQMDVRIAALECLCSYTKLTVAVLLPFKSRVLHELMSCLDDKKRLVRKQAVKTRTRWFVVGVS